MNFHNPFIDPGSGRYGGDDPAMARAFFELQSNFRSIRADAIVVVNAAAVQGGQYTGQELIDKTNADGSVATDANWGMTLATPTTLIVNVLEVGASSHNIPIGTRLVGRRRPNADESDTVFVNYPASFLYAAQWAGFYDTGASLFYGIGNPA